MTAQQAAPLAATEVKEAAQHLPTGAPVGAAAAAAVQAPPQRAAAVAAAAAESVMAAVLQQLLCQQGLVSAQLLQLEPVHAECGALLQ